MWGVRRCAWHTQTARRGKTAPCAPATLRLQRRTFVEQQAGCRLHPPTPVLPQPCTSTTAMSHPKPPPAGWCAPACAQVPHQGASNNIDSVATSMQAGAMAGSTHRAVAHTRQCMPTALPAKAWGGLGAAAPTCCMWDFSVRNLLTKKSSWGLHIHTHRLAVGWPLCHTLAPMGRGAPLLV